jgi:hypothetical protein
MAKEKNSSDKSAPKKTAAKKSPAKKAAAKNAASSNFTPAEIAAAPAVATSAAAPRKQPSAAELYEEIRRRAFEIYCERGANHGSHEADWHRAEVEVRSKYK